MEAPLDLKHSLDFDIKAVELETGMEFIPMLSVVIC